MGVTTQGAPDFRIGGDPGSISTRAAVMMDRANEFEGIHSSLISLNSDGWTGRAADHFREKFKIQVQGWADAQEAFSSASSAYSAYASTLQSAQSQCDEIRSRWEQGRQAVEQAQNNKADARSQAAAQGGIPMFDASCDEGPGRATMQGAEADFQALVDEVNDSGTALIAALDAGIAKLPERTWGDAAWRTAGSILRGLFEGVDSMIKLMLLGTPNLCHDLGRLWGGSITPAEFQAKYLDIPLETVSSIASALANDPGAFFTELGKALVDWDTWSDDPGRAFGRILPDIAITIATAGAAAGAKGLTGSARLAYIGREVFLQTTHISDIQDIGRLSSALVKKIGNMGSHAATSMASAVKHIPDMPATHTRVPGGANHSIGPSGTPSIPTTSAPNHPGHGTPGIPSAVAPNSPGHGTSGAPNSGHTSGPSHGGAAAMDSSAPYLTPGHQPNGTSATAQPGVTQYATGSTHSPADDSQNPLGATIPAKSEPPIPAPPKSEPPIPAPPKSEPPIPAPPQADTPSANTPSETHYAGNTGADAPHRADSPTTEAEGAGETSTDNKHKTEYGSTEPDGASHATDHDMHKSGKNSAEHMNGNPNTAEHSTNGEADDANLARQGDTTETDTHTSDKSHNDDDTGRHDAERFPKEADDKHVTKNTDTDGNSNKEHPDNHTADHSHDHNDVDPRSRPKDGHDLASRVPIDDRQMTADDALETYERIGMVPNTRGSDAVHETHKILGEHPDGTSYTHEEWLAESTKDGKLLWPKNGGYDGEPLEFDNVDAYRKAHGSNVDRIGHPGGSYLGAIEDDGGPASFEARSLSPSSLHDRYYQYEFTDNGLPEGWRIKAGPAAKWKQQPGGATQLQLIDQNGNSVSVMRLLGFSDEEHVAIKPILRGKEDPIPFNFDE